MICGTSRAKDTFSDQMQPRIVTSSEAQRQNTDSDDKDHKDDSSENSVSKDKEHTGNTENETGKNVKPSQTKVQITSRMVDDGPEDKNSKGPVDSNRIKKDLSGNQGVRFAPGEKPADGKPVNSGSIDDIESQQTQIHTFDGGVQDSNNFQDLNKRVQQSVKDGGGTIRSD